MSARVLGEVVAAHEAGVAQRAREVLLARVGARVPGQFVRPGEPLAALGPGAGEGALTCRRKEGLEMLHLKKKIK